MNSTANDFISKVMGFNPTDLSVFQETPQEIDNNIYRTRPQDSVSDDGIYRSKIKVLLNPSNPNQSIVQREHYWMESMDGSRVVRSSLSIGDKNCPIFKAWKRHWYSNDDTRKEFAKQVFDKNRSYWVLVQILEDENQPELVGKFKYMKLAQAIYEKLVARMNPSASSKKHPYPVMDYIIGLELNLEVQPGPKDPANPNREFREISYNLSEFGEYAPCIKVDGSPLLSPDELDLVDTFMESYKQAEQGRTDQKRKEAKTKLKELKPQVNKIYEKVIPYVVENMKNEDETQMDLVTYCGYSEWDDETRTFVTQWIEMTNSLVDPSTCTYEDFKAGSFTKGILTNSSKTNVNQQSKQSNQQSNQQLNGVGGINDFNDDEQDMDVPF